MTCSEAFTKTAGGLLGVSGSLGRACAQQHCGINAAAPGAVEYPLPISATVLTARFRYGNLVANTQIGDSRKTVSNSDYGCLNQIETDRCAHEWGNECKWKLL
jgi:hypothetical protein